MKKNQENDIVAKVEVLTQKHDTVGMARLRVFCFCFTPKTGSVILGCLGIVFAVFAIIPPCLLLESHDYYIREFVKQQREVGGKQDQRFPFQNHQIVTNMSGIFFGIPGMDLREEDIPKLQYFNKCVLAGIVSYDVVFIFACTLLITGKTNPESYSLSSVQNVQLISGIAADKKCLIVPWLVIKLMSWLFSLVFVISIMFAVANVQEILLYVLFPCGKFFLILKSKELLFHFSSHSQVSH